MRKLFLGLFATVFVVRRCGGGRRRLVRATPGCGGSYTIGLCVAQRRLGRHRHRILLGSRDALLQQRPKTVQVQNLGRFGR